MSLYQQWLDRLDSINEKDQKFWKDYFNKEKEAYRQILAEGDNRVTSNFTDLAKRFQLEPMEMMGFLDGISESLNTDLPDLHSFDEESEVDLDINFEKLLWNMHKSKAPWLFKLKEWENIFSPEKIQEIDKEYKRSQTYVNTNKVGRNDPCPCGSGKKYKKCCGRNKQLRE